MKYYLYLCRDIADEERAGHIRRERLADHLKYVEANLESYAVAGPNRDGDDAYHSSTFIVIAQDLGVADELMAGDPYVSAGLYQSVMGVEFVPAAGEWVGGKLWS